MTDTNSSNSSVALAQFRQEVAKLSSTQIRFNTNICTPLCTHWDAFLAEKEHSSFIRAALNAQREEPHQVVCLRYQLGSERWYILWNFDVTRPSLLPAPTPIGTLLLNTANHIRGKGDEVHFVMPTDPNQWKNIITTARLSGFIEVTHRDTLERILERAGFRPDQHRQTWHALKVIPLIAPNAAM